MKRFLVGIWILMIWAAYSQKDVFIVKTEDPYSFMPVKNVYAQLIRNGDTLYYFSETGRFYLPAGDSLRLTLTAEGYQRLSAVLSPTNYMHITFTPTPEKPVLEWDENVVIDAVILDDETSELVPEGNITVMYQDFQWQTTFQNGRLQVTKDELPSRWWKIPGDAELIYRVEAPGYLPAETTNRVMQTPTKSVFRLKRALKMMPRYPLSKPIRPDETLKEKFGYTEPASARPGATACDRLPSTIRVGINCDCNDCSSVLVMDLETYVQKGLNDEWIASWHAESLKAGSLPYRTYGAYYVLHPIRSNYDISNTPCKQTWDDDLSSSCYSAATATAGQYLETPGGAIAFSEYSAENNCLNPSSSYPCNCGDGYSGNGTDWPCIEDPVCAGHDRYGHGRGMCQWGSSRWADNGKLYTWINDHYYNPGYYYRCGTEHPHPDFAVTNLQLSDTDLQPGETLEASVDIQNPTSYPTDKNLLGVYLSADTVPDTNDYMLDSSIIWPLDPAESVTKTFNLLLPDDLNDYAYLLFAADPDNIMYETDENNNTLPWALNGGQNIAQENWAASVKIYPMPVTDVLYMEIPEEIRVDEILLLDLAGRELQKVSSAVTEWDLSFLPPGSYFLILKDTDGREALFKIIKH